MTPHIESTKDMISPLVLMPGDPKRAEYIAKNYLEDYKQVNSIRGMNAYTGTYKNHKITIFPSGMGIPSMGIYSYELFKYYDVECIIRVGSMGSNDKNIKLNDVVVVSSAYSTSNYTKELTNKESTITYPDSKLNDIILKEKDKLNINTYTGEILCTECFYNNINDDNYIGVEMESTALFANANYLKKSSAVILTVSDLLYDKTLSLTPKERETSLNNMIILGLNSLISYKEDKNKQ